jgi:hypothetical protein
MLLGRSKMCVISISYDHVAGPGPSGYSARREGAF